MQKFYFLLLFTTPVFIFANEEYSNENKIFVQNESELLFYYNASIEEKIVVLEPYSIIKVRASNIPRNIHHAVFQAHSQVHQITMSHHSAITLRNHVNGTNVGLVSILTDYSTQASVFLHNPHSFNVTALTFVLFYDQSAPIPGGCNLEFEVEIAPWLRVFYDSNIIIVDHAPAVRPYSRRGRPPSCETSSLHYEVFHYYLPQRDFSENTYFDAIRKMRTVQGSRDNGREIRLFGFTPTTRSNFSLYSGIGRVFVVTVTYTADGNLPAVAYVPAVTYGCKLDQEDGCQILSLYSNRIFMVRSFFVIKKAMLLKGTTYSKIICAFSLFIGFFIAFAGHRYFQIEMFVMGFSAFAIISYIVLTKNFDPNVDGLAAGTSVLGILGGLLWWFVWWYWGIPALSVLLVVSMLGFLLACIVFYIPLSFEFLVYDFNFWAAFACCWLVIPVIFITFTRLANIISCAIIGSYAIIIPVDHYIGSSLKYIIVNIIRRATVGGFGRSVLDPPYQDNDMILTIAWIGLSISGIAFQYFRERKRPPFSPPSEMWRTNSLTEERTPLIGTDSTPNYTTI